MCHFGLAEKLLAVCRHPCTKTMQSCSGCRVPLFSPMPGCDLQSQILLHVLALELPQLFILLMVKNMVPRIRSGF